MGREGFNSMLHYEKEFNNTKLQGPCMLKNAAIWLRKQTAGLVSDTCVVSVIYLKPPNLLEEINTKFHTMPMSQMAELEETQQ